MRAAQRYPHCSRRHDFSCRSCCPRYGSLPAYPAVPKSLWMKKTEKFSSFAGKTFHEGDYISIDGSTGNIYDGIIPTVDAAIAGEFGRIMATGLTSTESSRFVQTPTHLATLRRLVNSVLKESRLCRTEHMFFGEGRIDAFREMICSETVEEREKALAKILPMQQADFEDLYEALEGTPVCIRFLDPRSTSSFPPLKKTSKLSQRLRASPLKPSRLSSLPSTSSTP